MHSGKSVEWLRQQSLLARRLSQAQLDPALQRRLGKLADEYDAEAERRAVLPLSDLSSESQAS